jgi:hypothetical protein
MFEYKGGHFHAQEFRWRQRFKSLNLYLTTNKFKTEAHQLRLAFEEITGKDLNWFFNQWLSEADIQHLILTTVMMQLNR